MVFLLSPDNPYELSSSCPKMAPQYLF
jgi:hypothetical protein